MLQQTTRKNVYVLVPAVRIVRDEQGIWYAKPCPDCGNPWRAPYTIEALQFLSRDDTRCPVCEDNRVEALCGGARIMLTV